MFDTNLEELEVFTPELKPDVIDQKFNRVFHFSIAQNTEEWQRIRRGKVTASNAACLLVSTTTSTGKPTAGSEGPLGKGAVTYAKKIAMELLYQNAGFGEEKFYNDAMQRGHEHEHEAAMEFERKTDLKTDYCGFISMSNRMGASPDRLVKDKKIGLEMKSARADIHFDRLLDPESFIKQHYAQVQFNLLVSGYDRWALTSYNPTFSDDEKLLITWVERDEVVISKLQEQVRNIHLYADKLMQSLRN